ncbi:MAG: HEAT repeat domain-containing protein [Gemmatimonadota bacterium]
MTRNICCQVVGVALLLTLGAVDGRAQSLDRRIAAVAGSAVQFNFAARSGICGDGRNYVRLDGDSWYGTMNEMTRGSACEAGPVRVLVVKSGAEPIRLETYAGPLAVAPDATDLGRVTAADAVSYLGTLATTGEGRVSRDAVLALGMADSARVTPVLLSLMRDANRPRDTRRSALNWIVRRDDAPDALPSGELLTLLTGLARNETEPSSFRQSVIGTLGRLDRGEGIPALVEMSRSTNDGWTARRATEALARSGDPRARRAVREIARDKGAPSEVRIAAMSGLAGEYGSAEDAQILIALYPALDADRLQEAALGGIASIGSVAGRQFLLRIVKDEQHDSRPRRKAASLLERAGVPVRDVIGVYDGVSDGDVRVQLIEMLAQAGTREATEKLVSIAKLDTQPAARRRAIALLGRSDDASVREALRGIVGQST